MPPLGVELTDRQKLACLHRILAPLGFNDHVAGHVTMIADDAENLWASPRRRIRQSARRLDPADTPRVLARQLVGRPDDGVRAVCWANAGALFRHPVRAGAPRAHHPPRLRSFRRER